MGCIFQWYSIENTNISNKEFKEKGDFSIEEIKHGNSIDNDFQYDETFGNSNSRDGQVRFDNMSKSNPNSSPFSKIKQSSSVIRNIFEESKGEIT